MRGEPRALVAARQAARRLQGVLAGKWGNRRESDRADGQRATEEDSQRKGTLKMLR